MERLGEHLPRQKAYSGMTTLKANNAIKRIQKLRNNFDLVFCTRDKLWIDGYIRFCQQIADAGGFEPTCEDILKNMSWNKYNIRYGVRSIRGFAGEVLAVALWNIFVTGSVAILNTGKKEDEMAGSDIFITAQRWKKDYPAQVKLANLHNPTSRIYFQPNWFNYRNLDRFILADITHHSILHLNYEPFTRQYRHQEHVVLQQLLSDKRLNPILLK